MIAVIMAGGSGKRFWPLSRQDNPKQFLRIVSEKSMIQMTVDRLREKIDLNNIFIVTAASQAELVKMHLPDLPEENIILEPKGMNTAPAIALSALFVSRKYTSTEKMFVLPSDSVIQDIDRFVTSLDPAEKAAELDNLVTFGIQPTYPATGYGYIEGGETLKNGIKVQNFKEKPDIKSAEKFIKAGNYYWNSGMFLWKIDTILEAYSRYLPKVYNLLNEINTIWNSHGMKADISEVYSKMPKIPVDIGIMEQADKRVVIPVDYGWNDVGGWKALHDISIKDAHDNAIHCESEIIDSSGNYLYSNKFVALIGVKNLVIVDTPDALLVSDIDKSESIKDIVVSLEQKAKNKLL